MTVSATAVRSGSDAVKLPSMIHVARETSSSRSSCQSDCGMGCSPGPSTARRGETPRFPLPPGAVVPVSTCQTRQGR